MDYRLQAVIDSARSAKTYADQRAEAQRSRTVDSANVDTSREIAIARLGGESNAYQWVIDQLASFEREIPAAGGDAGASAPTTGGGHRGGSGCQECRGILRQARDNFNAMCREAQSYGWSDSDAQRFKSELGRLLNTLKDYMDSHG